MDEFHDFVVDVGLETKKYKFDVMCNQFIKVHDGARLEQRRFTHTRSQPHTTHSAPPSTAGTRSCRSGRS